MIYSFIFRTVWFIRMYDLILACRPSSRCIYIRLEDRTYSLLYSITFVVRHLQQKHVKDALTSIAVMKFECCEGINITRECVAIKFKTTSS